METEQLITKLNWFYSLEQSQVELYSAQSNRVKDPYLSKALIRFAYIEQQHIDNLADMIKQLGGAPTSMGDLIAPLVGKTMGNLAAMTNVKLMLETNILLETKAMADYRKLMKQVRHETQLYDVLCSNLIDEDLHCCWMGRMVSHIENGKQD